ncbi:MAG TPA: aminotransferase class I/II-fold pyridoxal phosphate-dependent enzyme [Chloroflexia bacterium]|nr:aminotransferase class I/II-fold pyridoxal phosphate-dependent enzyme [Chloroflexia bacterium]
MSDQNDDKLQSGEGGKHHRMQTRLIHGARAANSTSAVTPPIFATSTFELATPEEGAALAAEVAPAEFYARYGSPNNKQVELMLADLEGAEAALVLGSGAAAITVALMSNLAAGDHIVAQHMHYTSAMTMLAEVLPRYGVEVTQVDQTDTGAFERALRPNTKVVYTESPTNPTLELTDLRATAALAHSVGALAITDNTFASSYNQRPLSLGYDIVLHSATKYLNGHSDITAGALMGSREIIERAWVRLRVYGPVLHPFDSWLLRRGLLTYPLRMDVHNRNALEVGRFLEGHKAVGRVFYPGLPSHPQHELALKQMPGGFGGMVTFEMKGGFDPAYRLIGRTKLCVLAVSLGGVESLITHPASMIHTHQSEEQREAGGVSPGLIRLSVGLEAAEDIIEDLDQAMS